jgi:glycine cleavage system H protein
MSTTNTYTIIPEGELRCVWMDAGVVGFKLCDQHMECESCQFHQQVTLHQYSEAQEANAPLANAAASANSATAKDLFSNLVRTQTEKLRRQSLPDDRLHHRNHFWIQKKPVGNKYLFGIDHVAAEFFRPVLSVVFAPAPAIVKQNDPCCWLVTTAGAIPVRCPLDATIMSYNPALALQSGLIDNDSYQSGWLMELTVKARAKGLDEFVEHQHAAQQFERQLHSIETVFMDAFDHVQPSAGITMNDGGVVMDSIPAVLGQKMYYNIISRLLQLPL